MSINNYIKKYLITKLVDTTLTDRTISPFDTYYPCSISVEDYIDRIYYLCQVENSVFIASLILIDRFLNMSNRKLDRIIFYRLYSISLIITIKLLSEIIIWGNIKYVKIIGLDLPVINSLEKKFLQIIDWDLYIDSKEYKKMCNRVLG